MAEKAGRHRFPVRRRARTVEERRLDVLILGPVPPPFGGMSIHLSRLVPLLENRGLDVAVLNHFRSASASFVVGVLRRNPVRYYLLPRRFPARIVHYHHTGWLNLVATALGKRNQQARYVVTLHGDSIFKHLRLDGRLEIRRRITKWALLRFDAVIAVNEEIAKAIRPDLAGKQVAVIPAFLEPPDASSEAYEPALEAFLASGRTLVVAAYDVKFLHRGSELYGLDLAVGAMADLAAEWPGLRLALFVAKRPLRPTARRHLALLEQRLEQAGIRERAYIAFGCPLLPALRENVIFVRPTRADGDALSIREAQQAGIPVVASDVSERPPGVVLFPAGDVVGLCSALRAVLEGAFPDERRAESDAAKCSAVSFANILVHLYLSELDAYVGMS